MMGALADDQRVIEDVLEAERLRVEESLRAAATARKARDDRHAEEDAVQERFDDKIIGAAGAAFYCPLPCLTFQGKEK